MDFVQDKITTIHDFCIKDENLKKLVEDLVVEKPVAIVIPMLYEEIYNPSLGNIIKELNKVNYVHKVVVALYANNAEEYLKVKQYFEVLNLNHLIVWCNGQNIQEVLVSLKERDLDVTRFSGKGKDTWIAIGIASLDSYAIALNDADASIYSSIIPAKLLFPILDPELDFFFNKGYYARINFTTRCMFGRVFRLFVHPLLDAFRDKLKESEFIEYIRAFRYPLSGEFAITSDLALNIRIPGDWGLEIGILAEVYKNSTYKRICQTDLGYYEHIHREIGVSRTHGLSKMVSDITKILLRTLTECNGLEVTESFLHSLQVLYKRYGQDHIRQYNADAKCNNLRYNRHLEESTVDTFSNIIIDAGKEYIDHPIGMLLPDWTRAISAMHTIRTKLKDAAYLDLDLI